MISPFPCGSVSDFEKFGTIGAAIKIAEFFRIEPVFFCQTKFAQCQRGRPQEVSVPRIDYI